MLSLGEVIEATGGAIAGAGSPRFGQRFSSVVVDSRQVTPGALFVALKGQKHDGHAFVAQSLGRGASAAIVERVPADCVWAQSPDAEGPPLIVVPSPQTAP